MAAQPPPDSVSRARYARERRAREEAESLLEAKSRELFEANDNLERLVAERTARLTEALAAAEEAGAMRARFLAVMSHEIRTPLGGLMGMLDLLREEALPPVTRDLVEVALHSADSLKRIVDDILDLSALDAGRMRFVLEPVDLRALAHGVCTLLEPRAAARGLSLRISIADDVPARLRGDATRLRQVLSNLCDNAVKFSDSGTVRLTASTVQGGHGPLVRVTVCDEGPGVAEADRARLFADFGQLDAGLTKRAQGAGLGLSISRRIVEGLGGRIGVADAPGAGAAFWFEIPLQSVEAGDAASQDAPQDAPPRDAAPALAGRRVLVVEDHPVNRRLIGAYLARLGTPFDVATNGLEAVRMAQRTRYDVILMDLAMPEMDGVSAAMAIRGGDGRSLEAPIIAFTAHVMPSVQRDCLAAGMAEVLAKPASFAELAAALARHTGCAAPASDALAPPSPAPAIVEAFRRDTQVRIALIRQALKGDDRHAVAREAHSIRGAAGLFDAAGAHEIAAAIEDGAQHLDVVDIEEALVDLARAIDTETP